MPAKRSRARRKSRSTALRNKKLPLWIIGILVVFLLSVFLSGNRSLIKLYTLREERAALLQEKERLEKENARLQAEIERLQTDMEYIEKEAREKYNLKRENEDVYQVVPSEKK